MQDPHWLHLALTFILTAGGYVVTALYVPRILLRKREPGATLTWLFVVIAFPYIGVFLYIVFGNNRVKRRRDAKRKSDKAIADSLRRLPETPPADLPLASRPRHASVLQVSARLGVPQPVSGNSSSLYPDGPSAFNALLAAIESARQHLHLEFFLFRSDATGRRVLDALSAAARRGVEVRLLVDSVGQFMSRTPDDFFDMLREAGGQVVRFLPVGFVRGWSFFNLRNHRKLVVADGLQAFTGGMNVGDEYAGSKDRRNRPWRDILVRVEGPAVRRLQQVFAEDWYFATGQSLADPSYFPPPRPAGDEFVQVVASGPDGSLSALHGLTLALIDAATEHVLIATPYFIPDPALASTIEMAALRGVHVRILVPERSNHLLAQWAGRSYFEDLLEAGVEIYQYARGMLHAKALVVDGRLCAVGSANMDIRSFRLNFELNLLFYGGELASQLERALLRDFALSRRIDPKAFSKRPALAQLAETTARILSPVL